MIYTKINGKWEKVISPAVKIAGHWTDSADQYIKINGKWVQVEKPTPLSAFDKAFNKGFK